MTITKATPADAGCYVDGHWGQYAVAHMVNRAEEFGYSEAEVISLADRHIASIGPSDAPGITDDEHEVLIEASDDVERWLNDNVAPDGYSFGWFEGEFYLWPDVQWEDPFSADDEQDARPACTVCGAALDPTDFGGYVHLDDGHEDHTPVL